MATRPDVLMALAVQLVRDIPDFFDRKGPGQGNKTTDDFMRALRKRAEKEFGEDYSEVRISQEANTRFDFYFPDEATVVEVALGLRNPNSEFEKDILKVLLAKKAGKSVRKLVFIAKEGAEKKHSQPSSVETIRLVKDELGIEIEIRDILPLLQGED